MCWHLTEYKKKQKLKRHKYGNCTRIHVNIAKLLYILIKSCIYILTYKRTHVLVNFIYGGNPSFFESFKLHIVCQTIIYLI